jgi:hypothetical protein
MFQAEGKRCLCRYWYLLLGAILAVIISHDLYYILIFQLSALNFGYKTFSPDKYVRMNFFFCFCFNKYLRNSFSSSNFMKFFLKNIYNLKDKKETLFL